MKRLTMLLALQILVTGCAAMGTLKSAVQEEMASDIVRVEDIARRTEKEARTTPQQQETVVAMTEWKTVRERVADEWKDHRRGLWEH